MHAAPRVAHVCICSDACCLTAGVSSSTVYEHLCMTAVRVMGMSTGNKGVFIVCGE